MCGHDGVAEALQEKTQDIAGDAPEEVKGFWDMVVDTIMIII